MAVPSWLNVTIQILLAFIIVMILYIITLVVLNIDTIIVTSTTEVKPQETSVVLSGYAPVSYLSGKSYNTINSYADNYIKIGKSMNTHGGSQFTYQFWVRIDDPTDAYFNNLILLLKGDNRKYKIGLYDMNNRKQVSKMPSDYVISCPLIKFVDSYRHMRVQFNTANNPMTAIDINMNPNDGTMGRRNALSLLPMSWYMMTFVFQDNFSYTNASENGINFKFFLNDFPYQENTASDNPSLRSNTIKQNEGNLYLVPNPPKVNSANFMRMGNVKYFNYALSEEEVRSLYAGGPPTVSAIETTSRKDLPAHLSAYNKIDIYNY